MNTFKFKHVFTLSNGLKLTLNEQDMFQIHDAYQKLCTQEYILQTYPKLTTEKAWNIAAEARWKMLKYDFDENEAIEKTIKELGYDITELKSE